MKIDVDGTALESLIEKGVVDALGETAKTAIVAEVVRYLTTKTTNNSYGENTTPLFAALREATRGIAKRILTERLEKDPEFVAEVEKLYADAAQRMFGVENREAMVARLADAMSEALTKDRYR